MKIVFVTVHYHPEVGGVEKHVCQVAKSLVAAGHEVTVVTATHDPKLPRHDVNNGVRVLRLHRSTVPVLGRVLVNMEFMGNLGLLLGADVVHYHDVAAFWGWGLASYPLLRLFGKKVFLTFHGWEGVVPPRRAMVMRRRVSATLAAGTLSIGAFIDRWYGTRSDSVSYGGVDHLRYKSDGCERADSPLRVVYLGRFASDTGLPLLVEAIRLSFPELGGRLHFDFIGTGPLEGELKLLQAEGGGCIKVMAPVSDTAAVVKDATVVVASGYLSILEALTARRIVITLYTNPLREDYLRCHPAADSLWICGTPQEVRAALLHVLDRPDEARIRSEAGWHWAKSQSWENVAGEYLLLWASKGIC